MYYDRFYNEVARAVAVWALRERSIDKGCRIMEAAQRMEHRYREAYEPTGQQARVAIVIKHGEVLTS